MFVSSFSLHSVVGEIFVDGWGQVRWQGGTIGKDLPANAGDMTVAVSIPGSGRCPWRRKWQPTPVFLPGKFHGQRSLTGYSPWGHKESDTIEQLSTQAPKVTKFVIVGDSPGNQIQSSHMGLPWRHGG